MKTFFVHTFRIIAGVMLPLGTLFFGIFLISIFLNPGAIFGSVMLLYIAAIVLFLVIPLCVIFFLNPRSQSQMIGSAVAVSEAQTPFIKRPIGNLIPVIILVIVGLIPLFYFIVIEIAGFSGR